MLFHRMIEGQSQASLTIFLAVLQECARFMRYSTEPSVIFSIPNFDIGSSRNRTYSTYSRSEPMTPIEERLFHDWERDPKYTEYPEGYDEGEKVHGEEEPGTSKRSRSLSNSSGSSRSRSRNRDSEKIGARSVILFFVMFL